MTYTTWDKAFWNRGSDFSPAWAVPAQQRPAAIHTIDFNSYWTGPWYPFQSKFWLLNWNTELWAAPAQDTASLHQSCGEAADPLLWTGSHDGDGIHGSWRWPELSSWFSLLLEVHVQKASSLQARGLLSICSPKRHRDGRRSSPFPRGARRRTGTGLGGLGCGPALAGRRAVLRWTLPALLSRRVIYMCCVSACCLSWTDNFSVGCVVHPQRGELEPALC